ncbi:MAG: PD-(D/E)XK nuclease family protein [Eubacterium sp.]|nr:PD-(D/E)XK nuclease family protein [Eubacterium sp.]
MLKFVFGRSGFGKTEYCFSQIEALVKGGEKNILLITPEQYNFTAEKRLLKSLGEADINKVENSSFSRLSNEAARLYGGNALPVLSKGGKAVLMKKAIDSVKDKLTVFNNKTDSSSFVVSMVRIYDEMSSCDISSADLLSVSSAVEKEILSRKLFDMSLIIGAYGKLLNGNYFDSADELSRLYEKLINTDFFKGRSVFIDGFNGFVASEYKILELIIKEAKNVTVTLATDSYFGSDQFDLFTYVNKNAKKLQSIAEKYGIPVEFVTLEKNYRTSDEALLFAEKNLYSRRAEQYEGETDSISLYSAKNVSDECDYIALQIKKELRAGRRARDIAVICREADFYTNELIYAFRKYDIPYYVDERQPINTQPLMVFVQYLLRAVVYSCRSDDILSLAKTGLTELDREKISNLENYVYIWNISGVKKWSNPFISSTKGFTAEMTDSDKKRLEEINASRKYLFNRINRFKNSVKNETAREISRGIYELLHSFSVNKHLKEIAQSLSEYGRDILAEEQGRVWDILMDILNQLAVICGDEKISLKDYLSLFSIMTANEDLGVLPQGLDNVQFGQADRIRADNPKSVYILGANEGEFPKAVMSGGLLSESDRIILSKKELELYSFGETLNLQERYFAYMATAVASERLCVTYLGNCANPVPSVIVSSLKKCFPNIKEIKYSDIPEIDLVESRASAFELMAERFNDNTEFSESLKEFFKNDDRYSAVRLLSENDEINIHNAETSTDLFGKDMYLSASRLEDFFNCRFRYFCKYGLMARPREKAEMNAMKTGTVIHYVLENLIAEIGSAELGRSDEAKIKLLVDKYLKQYLETEMGSNEYTGRFTYQYLRLSKMLYSVVGRLAEEFAQSKFEAKAFELSIDKDGEVKPKMIPLESGGSVRLRGEIDRVDILEENGNKYVRVVDYKSGSKKFSLSDILYGLNLQMFVYLFTLCADENSEYCGTPAGVLYMHAARSVLKADRGADVSDISKMEAREFKMKGLVLYDEDHDILESMEKDLAGKYIPVKYSKKNGITGCFASLEELGRISQKVESLIAEMGNLLQSGSISQNPINGKNHDKTCEFCDYSDVCANRRMIENREIEVFDDDADAMNKLKEE